MCGIECITQIICLIFVLVSLPIYILFICVLIKKRRDDQFNSSFYRICIILGIVDLITITHYYLFRRSGYWNLLVSMHQAGGEWLLRYQTFMVLGNHRCQKILVLIITLNRYTGITQPLRAESMWNPRFTTWCWALALVFSYGSSLNIGFCAMDPLPGVKVPKPEMSGFVIPWGNPCWGYNPKSALLVSFVFSGLFLVLYTRMFYLSYRRSKRLAASRKSNAASAAESERASRNIAIIGCALSSMIVVHAVQFVILGLYREFYSSAARRVIADVTWALFSMGNPWLVFLCVRKARKAFLEFVRLA